MQLRVRDLKARIARLQELAKGLGKEVGLQRDDDGVGLARGRKQYLTAVQESLAGMDEARVVLGRAVKRLEGHPSW
jgi:hypothetical protein